MPHIVMIKSRLSKSAYDALKREKITDLDKLSAMGPRCKELVGAKAYGEIVLALAEYEAEHNATLERPRHHPLIAFGLSERVSDLLFALNLETAEAVFDLGRHIKREGGVGERAFAEIAAATQDWRRWYLQNEVDASREALASAAGSISESSSVLTPSNIEQMSEEQFSAFAEDWRVRHPDSADTVLTAAERYWRAVCRRDWHQAILDEKLTNRGISCGAESQPVETDISSSSKLASSHKLKQ